MRGTDRRFLAKPPHRLTSALKLRLIRNSSRDMLNWHIRILLLAPIPLDTRACAIVSSEFPGQGFLVSYRGT